MTAASSPDAGLNRTVDFLAVRYLAVVAELAEARRAVERVRDLHAMAVDSYGNHYCDWCDENVTGYGTHPLWPCGTIRALDGSQ